MSKVFSRENVNVIPECQNLPFVSPINDVYFSENDVKQKIFKLKTSSSKGPDNISTRFLKDFGDVLSKPLLKKGPKVILRTIGLFHLHRSHVN